MLTCFEFVVLFNGIDCRAVVLVLCLWFVIVMFVAVCLACACCYLHVY